MAKKSAAESTKQAEAAPVGGVQSLHRALAILQVISDNREGIGLLDLSNAVGLHRSTTFHLAKTMVSLGLLRQKEGDKRYRVGRRLFSLASGSFDEIELIDIAFPVLEELSEQVEESSHLAVRTGFGTEIAIISRCDTSATIRLTERVGATRPAYATAIGKVLLAGLKPDQLVTAIADMDMDMITRRTIASKEQLAQEIADVAENGFAFDDGEYDIDVRCLAAPVVDFRNQTVAAIGFSSPVWRFDERQIGTLSQKVIASANKLSQLLGAKAKSLADER